MKLSVHVVLHTDEGTDPVMREVLTVQREALTDQMLGLQLAEAKDLLEAVQDAVVNAQVTQALVEQAPCPHCGRSRRHKDSRDIVVRSLFGILRLPSPRWWHCGCQSQSAATFSPLAELLPARTTPELAYLQPASPGSQRMGCRRICSVSCCPRAGGCTPPPCADKPRRWLDAWTTSSVTSASASSTPASATVNSCPARTCR
jgi:hypothetical protein